MGEKKVAWWYFFVAMATWRPLISHTDTSCLNSERVHDFKSLIIDVKVPHVESPHVLQVNVQ